MLNSDVKNRCITTDEVALQLDISHGFAYHIFHDALQYHKICARWMPKQLTSELKEQCMNACKELLGYCQTERDACLQCIVTGDESWPIISSQKQRERAKSGNI